MSDSPVCVITGVGPGNGWALTRRFAQAGYRVAMLARDQERLASYAAQCAQAQAFPCDVSDPETLQQTLARVAETLGPVHTLIHNAGAGVFKRYDEITLEEMEQTWRINTLALLVAAQALAPPMCAAGQGNILVIGATAALRGKPQTAGFAAAKAAQRSLAQSLARTLGPQGVHVAYVVIDGVVDLPRTRQALPDKPDDFFLAPEDIAESVHALSAQPRSAWSFEVDLRPYGESW